MREQPLVSKAETEHAQGNNRQHSTGYTVLVTGFGVCQDLTSSAPVAYHTKAIPKPQRRQSLLAEPISLDNTAAAVLNYC